MTIANSLPDEKIAAVVLAAGLSTRMGKPKLLLPWGHTTVIGQVVGTLVQAGIDEIIVVSGATRQAVHEALAGLPAQVVFNARYREDSMLVSLQIGLAALSKRVEAALVVLGDQPQMQASVVEAIVAAYRHQPRHLVVPSYQLRRGHPWLIRRSLWADVQAVSASVTLRQFLAAQAVHIQYVNVATDSILLDLDTPEDYARNR